MTVTTIAGPTRYDTSALIAEAKYPNGVTSGHVVLATGAAFPDALAGNYLAGQLNAPVLLTPISTSDPNFNNVTVPALAKLLTGSTKAITVLGGNLAVGDDVVSALQAKGYTVNRIGGPTRYDTAQMIDTQTGLTPGNGTSGNKTAIIATGQNFPDALAAGPLAWAKKFPIVLTDGSQNALSPQAQATLTTLGIKNVLVMGGSNAISSGITTQLNGPPTSGMGITIDKQFNGVDRTDTAAQLATYEITNYGFNNSKVILASGANFPDALSGGALGGDPTPIVLTEPDYNQLGSTTAWLKGQAATLNTIIVLGGTFAVPTATAQAAQTAAQSTPTSAVALPTLVSASIVSTTSPAQATVNNVKGTVVQYVFSQNLTSDTFNPANFKVYPADDVVNGNAGYTGTLVCNGGNNCPASSNANAVNILFDSSTALETTSSSTADSAGSLTLAAVAGPPTPAVTTTTGASNPAGSVPIGSSTSVTPSANNTLAPNIVSVGTPTPGATAGTSAILVTFDKAVMPVDAGNVPVNNKFFIVFSSTAGNAANGVAGTGNQEVACQSPGQTENAQGTNLTQPGFNGSTVTIVCPQPSTNTAEAAITPSQIAWIVVKPNAVQTTGSTPIPNGYLEASNSPAQQSAAPAVRMTGLSFTAGSGTANDQALFNFDQPINPATVDLTKFFLVTTSGGSFALNPTVAPPNQCSTTSPANALVAGNPTPGACQVTSTGSSTQVLVWLPNGTLSGATNPNHSPVVGGGVTVGAVTATNAPNDNNADDELGAANSSPVTQAAGTINAVQLKSATATNGTNGLGQTTVAVTYNFSADIAAGGAANAFHAYDADGTELTCQAGALSFAPAGGPTTVVCTAFNQGTSGAAGTAATPSQLTGIVWVTVDWNAVHGTTGTQPAPSNFPNPEGAVAG